MELLRFPLFRIGIIFIGALVLLPPTDPWLAAPAFACCSLVAFFAKPKPVAGLNIMAATVLAAATVANLHQGKPENHYLKYVNNDSQRIFGTIHERIKNGRNSQRYVLCLQKIDKHPCTGKVLLNVIGTASPLPPGTAVAAETNLVPNRKPLNPGQFDYGAYLDNQSIYAQAYVPSSSILAGTREGGWRYQFDKVRQSAVSGIAASGMSAGGIAVLNALVLGQRQELDRGLVDSYELAGAVHILSVSGLHVGFVMMAIGALLRPIPGNASGRLTSLLIQLAFLWGFAVLTGLSPSVVRSAAMFSLLALGDSLRRPQNKFHTLMVSALLILLVDPSLLRDVGFQLSYAAVLFIVWLYPRLRELWTPENVVLKYTRDILAVSIAAQLGTLPLCLYYFHQFPGLFMLTNLVVIPLVTVIMLGGLLAMVIAIFTPAPKSLIWILECGVDVMNGAILKIASADRFAFLDLPFTFNMAIALSALILTISILICRPTKYNLIVMVVALILFQTTVLHDRASAFSRSEFIVFHDRKSLMIAIRQGRHLQIFSDAPDGFALRPYKIQAFADTEERAPLASLHYFAGRKILVARRETVLTGIRPDILVLTESPKLNLERALEKWRPQLIVADGTNFRSYVKRWSSTCHKQKIPFHSTSEKGYFKIRG